MSEAPKVIWADVMAVSNGKPMWGYGDWCANKLDMVGQTNLDAPVKYHHDATVTALEAKVARLEAALGEAVTALEHVLAGKPVRNADEIIARKALEDTQ